MSDAMQDGERAQRDRFRPSQVKVENGKPVPPLPVEPLKGFPGIHSALATLENTIASADLSVSELSSFLTNIDHKDVYSSDEQLRCGKSVQHIIDRINNAIVYVESLHAKINICKSEIMGE